MPAIRSSSLLRLPISMRLVELPVAKTTTESPPPWKAANQR
jgi:hypothetical protein